MTRYVEIYYRALLVHTVVTLFSSLYTCRLTAINHENWRCSLLKW